MAPHADRTTQVTMNLRRLEQEGVTPTEVDRGVDRIIGAIAADGPRNRNQLREVLGSAALVHGRAVATWRLAKNVVEVEPFAPWDPLVAQALRTDGDAVVQFLNAR